jgi:hypothetical protein
VGKVPPFILLINPFPFELGVLIIPIWEYENLPAHSN